HQFPFEADVAARFEVLDEASTAQLLDELILKVMVDAAAEPDSALGWALATAITAAADVTFKDLIVDMIRKRDIVDQWVNRAGTVTAAIEQLNTAFNLRIEDTIDAVEREYFS